MELLDGRSGVPHVTGEKLGKMNLGMAGDEGLVYKVGEQAKATVVDSNHVTVGTFAGQLPSSGRRVLLDVPETVTVQSGSQNRNRNDLIVARMTTETQVDSTIEGCELVVIQGTATTGSPADPSVQDGDLKLYRLPITGVNLGDPVPLFSVLMPLTELRDSVSRQWFVGNDSVNVTPSRDCDLIVFASRSNTWGYAGGDVQMSIDCPELTAVSKHIGKITLGDTIGRQLVSWAVFTGARAGVSYRPAIAYTGNPQQHDNETMLAITL